MPEAAIRCENVHKTYAMGDWLNKASRRLRRVCSGRRRVVPEAWPPSAPKAPHGYGRP